MALFAFGAQRRGAQQGRTPESFTPVERLCYTGTRGMGALEFHPPVRQGRLAEIRREQRPL